MSREDHYRWREIVSESLDGFWERQKQRAEIRKDKAQTFLRGDLPKAMITRRSLSPDRNIYGERSPEVTIEFRRIP